MSSKMRSLFIIMLDYLTLLGCYFMCLICFPQRALSFGAQLVNVSTTMVCLLFVYPLVLSLFKVYKTIHRYAQSAEYLRFFIAFFFAGLVFDIVMILLYKFFINDFEISEFFLLFQSMLSTFALLVTRIFYRVIMHRTSAPSVPQKDTKKALIVGCGDACLMLLNELKYHPTIAITPVVAVDEDAAKVGRMISGIKIEGTDEDIPFLCNKYGIDLVIIAIPSATNAQRAKIIDHCAGVNVEIKVLPRVSAFHESGSRVVDKLRDFTIDEVLGREQASVDTDEISSFIRGKSVLVTGGGGSIGSEICRQIAKNSPKKLVIVDIYENNAYDIQQELLYQYGDSLNLETIIASVRDYDRINSIIADTKPDFIIHAAAHKHVPLMEKAPQEAIKNNVFGTYNTAKAAIANGVEKFILISTDKAVNPTNIMGATKRICEMIIQSLNGNGTLFTAVRFGNVLGSNGSVIPLFQKQIKHGGPITVTHPDIIRFFMTIPEACQLVLLAGAKAEGGEIFVLNMGSPVKIDDLARKLVLLAGKVPDVDIEIKYTGLRPGEKLYEELMMNDEGLTKTENGKLFIGKFVDFDKNNVFAEIEKMGKIANDNSISQEDMLKILENEISTLVPTFHRSAEDI